MSENKKLKLYAPDGKPFNTKTAAQDHIKANGLDSNNYVPRQEKEGWVIIDLVEAMLAAEGGAAGSRPTGSGPALSELLKDREVHKGKTFRRVKLMPRTGDEPEDVSVNVCGDRVVIKRNKPIIMTLSHIEALTHASYIEFNRDETEGMRESAPISRFVLNDLGPATEEEYRAQILESRKLNRAHYGQSGEDEE